MAHGFGGTQQGSIALSATDFAGAGFDVLTFDYRGFGESGGEPRQAPSILGQQADWRAAIAKARTIHGVRAERIVLWGSSFSGGHVLDIASRDATIAAVIAQAPFNGFPKRIEGRTSQETRALLFAALRDWWAAKWGYRRFYLKAVGAPGEGAVMATREAALAVARMQNETWQNWVAPGVLIDMALWYRPGKRARHLQMPVLICLAQHDKVSPGALTSPIAARALRGELSRYPCGHFDLYSDPVRASVLQDQVRFLRRHLTEPEADAAR